MFISRQVRHQRYRPRLIVAAIVMAVLLGVLVAVVRADPPPIPATFYGRVTDTNGQIVPPGRMVTATCGFFIVVGQTWTNNDPGYAGTWYGPMDVTGAYDDHPGCVPGQAITWQVSRFAATPQRATVWQSGGGGRLDLSITAPTAVGLRYFRAERLW